MSAPGRDESAVRSVDRDMIASFDDSGEIDFGRYLRQLWAYRWVLLGGMLITALLAFFYARSLPDIYRAEVLLAQAGDQSGGGGGGRMSSLLGKFGGLASMAGVNLPQGDLNQSLAMLESREFLWYFYKQEKLYGKLFAKVSRDGTPLPEPDMWRVYRTLSAIINVDEDKMTGLITLSVTLQDSGYAAELANALVVRLNDYVRQQEAVNTQANLSYLTQELRSTQAEEMRMVLFELIRKEQQKSMLLNTRKQFVFKVIDAAIAPDYPVGPKRKKIVLGAIAISGFLIFIALIALDWLREFRKKDAHA